MSRIIAIGLAMLLALALYALHDSRQAEIRLHKTVRNRELIALSSHKETQQCIYSKKYLELWNEQLTTDNSNLSNEIDRLKNELKRQQALHSDSTDDSNESIPYWGFMGPIQIEEQPIPPAPVPEADTEEAPEEIIKLEEDIE